MRIAFITHYDTLYGANRSLLALIDGLRPYGVQSFVIAPYEGDITAALRERGVPYAIVRHQWLSSRRAPASGVARRIREYLSWRRGALRRLLRNLRVLPRMVRQLRDWEIDILYTNASVVPIGALASIWTGLPHVWHLREFGMQDYGLTLDWGTRVFDFMLRRSAAQISNSQAIRAHYASGLRPGRNHVVYNGIATREEIARLGDRARSREGSGDYVFAIAGVIRRNKGQDLAVRALAAIAADCPRASLHIYGEGDDEEIRLLAQGLGIPDRVVFKGYVDDPFDIYADADAVLMCSRNEAMGRVTVEAMAAARPVIGADSGGTPELIADGINGLLFDGSVEGLSACMRRLVEDPELGRRMGEAGHRIALEKYSVEAYAKSIFEILRGIEGTKRR